MVLVFETLSQREPERMIICLCTGFTDRDVRRAIDKGAGCMADVQSCGVGTGCGSCHDMLRAMLRERGAAEADLWCHLRQDEEEQTAAIA